MCLGDDKESAYWLIKGYEVYPAEPKAIANRILAHLVLGENEEAVELGRDTLKHDPGNELAAFYLIQAAARLPAETDPLKGIPTALRERSDILLGQIIFKRVKGDATWVQDSQRSGQRFPEDKRIQILAAEADVSEITNKGDYAVSFILPAAEHEVLQRAALLLTTEWEAGLTDEQAISPAQIDVASTAMVAWKLTRRQDKAIAIARKLVDIKVDDRQVLLNAAQIINDAGDQEYVEKAIALSPEAPELRFIKALRLVDEGDWDRAAAIFKEIEVPDVEREIVDVMIKLAPFRDPARSSTESEFRTIMPLPEADPRALIAFARVVGYRGFIDLATEAYANARKGIIPTTNMASRLMVASYADENNDTGAVIELLQGYIPVDEPSNELLRLATAHAIQSPKRPANVNFFNLLPSSIRQLPSYAKLHATVLLQLGTPAEAIAILKSLRETDPKDAYVILRLAEAYARLNQSADVKKLAEHIDPTNLTGRAEYMMAVAQLLMQHDRTQEALQLGYSVLLNNQGNPRVALGYTGLFLLDPRKRIVDTPETVKNGTAVILRDQANVASSLLIDDGQGFWGVAARAASADDVKSLVGQKKGFQRPLPRRFQTDEIQEIVEIKSKYLHIFHIVMDQFEIRFPGHGGLWQIRTKGEDIKPFLDVVRDLEEADRQTARRYVDEKWPLVFVARMLGRDVLSFAAYLRHLGHEVASCKGNADEYRKAIKLAAGRQGNGATLDFYTAAIAAKIGALPILKEWFGKIYIPSSTIVLCERLIAREKDKIDEGGMSINWTGSGYIRHIPTEEEIRTRIAALDCTKEQILAHAIVEKELLPDDIPEVVVNLAEKLGEAAFEGIYLARRKGTIFVCDDLPLREIATDLANVEAIWMQPILMAARDANRLEGGVYSKLLARLAASGHHTSIHADDLENVYTGKAGSTFYDFVALADCLGGKTAEMRSHVGVTIRFLLRLWAEEVPEYFPREKVTGIVLESLIRQRKSDWYEAIGYVAAATRRHHTLGEYIVEWLQGHFLPTPPVDAAFRRYKKMSNRLTALSLLRDELASSSSLAALEIVKRNS